MTDNRKCEAFEAAIKKLPESHWARYDLSAVRLGWELARQGAGEPVAWRSLLEAVMLEMANGRGGKDGNAPGHAHDIPGVWDSDNGELAGKPCAWCTAWNAAKDAFATAPEPLK